MIVRGALCFGMPAKHTESRRVGVGTMREFAEAFYKSKAWQATREAYAASAGRLCEACLSQGVCRAGEIVHHKRELTPENIGDPAVTFSWDNLQLLCRDCHAKAHGRVKRYRVDAFGRVSPR